MKYFMNAEQRVASGHENYIDFRLPAATEEFWDKTSLYMLETTLQETGFGDFWRSCMCEDIVFDMTSFSRDELAQMADKASGTILEVISELQEWIDTQFVKSIIVNWPIDRELERRRAQREAFPVDPKFYEEVKAMHEQYKDVPVSEYFAVTQEAYEALLRKYNMPSAFFPYSLHGSDDN